MPLTYPIPEEGRIVDAHPELNKKALSSLSNEEVAFIMYAYDPKSPFAKEKNPEARRQMAAERAGVEIKKGAWEDQINNGVREYFKTIHNRKWVMYISLSEMFYNANYQLMKPVEGELGEDKVLKGYQTQLQISGDLKGVEDQISALEKELFGEEGEDLVLEQLKVAAVGPERYARMSNGKA